MSRKLGVVLLCRSSSTASDPPICTNLHIPEAGSCPGHSRLYYGNGVLVGIPAHLMRRLQSVLNAAARLTFNLKRSDHITDALVSLHWLRVPERIQYKIAVLSYKVLHDTAPRYLGPLTRVADIPGRRAHCSRFGINTAVVPVPIENFFYFNDPLFISTVIVVSQ